jgi:hypothetical protein
VVALLAGVLSGRLAELGDEGVLDVAEAGVVWGAEQHAEVVGHDATTLDVDRAIVVHVAHQPAPELDGTDRSARTTSEHALDHTLQPTLD